jgi:uncharacterized surface protein with fasciclin (FAS1) repeats
MSTLNKLKTSLAAAVILGSGLIGVAEASQGGFRSCLRTKPIQFDGTIAQAAAATPALSTLTALVTKAGLVDALSGPGPLTVYAPVNSAFDAIPKDIVDGIVSDTDVLTSVLTYHVSPGIRDPRRQRIPSKVKTLQGQTTFFSAGQQPQVNQSVAACQAVRTSNGIVWLIDSVLLPQFKPAP